MSDEVRSERERDNNVTKHVESQAEDGGHKPSASVASNQVSSQTSSTMPLSTVSPKTTSNIGAVSSPSPKFSDTSSGSKRTNTAQADSTVIKFPKVDPATVSNQESPHVSFRGQRKSPAHKTKDTFNTSFKDPATLGHSSAVYSSPSVEANRPLLSSSVKRQSTFIISRIRKSIAAEREGDLETAELAIDEFEAGDEDKDDIDSTKHLLSAIRSLPNPMSEKRQYREELLKMVQVSDYEFLHFPIEAYYKRVKKGLPRGIKELQNKYNLWASSFKVIEGQFGTGVVSFFVFLRWLLFLNTIMLVISFIFLVLPQVIGTEKVIRNVSSAPAEDIFTTDFISQFGKRPPQYSALNSASNWNLIGNAEVRQTDLNQLSIHADILSARGLLDATLHFDRKNDSSKSRILKSEYCSEDYRQTVLNHTRSGFHGNVQDTFEGSGWMEQTILFIGYYVPRIIIFSSEYNMPAAFIIVHLVLVLINIMLMMSYASEGVQESVLEKLQEMYCYLVFCGWDFCVEEHKAAKRQHNSIYQELISTLAEDRRKAKMKEWTQSYKVKIFCIRMASHLSTVLILVGAYYLIFYVASVQLHAEVRGYASGVSAFFIQFLPSLTITGLNFLFPLILAIITPFEEYRIGRQISIMLMRIVLLREASVIILVSSFYYQIMCEPKTACGRGYEGCTSPLCWETYVGQQMYRLSIMDLFVHIAVTFAWETPRNYAVQKWNNKYTDMLGRPAFDIPTQVLSLVYSQTLSWLGMFYCPLLPVISVLKIIIFFYIKKFTVLKNCAPAQTAYKASRSNSIFVVVLMLSFFITIGILGYSVTQIPPSPGCSPFRHYNHMVHSLGEAMEEISPELNKFVTFTFSPLVAYPIIILLCLALYYYVTKAWAHQKMVKLLKVQLTMEGKDKQFLLDRVTKIRPKVDGSSKSTSDGSSKSASEKKRF